MNDKKKPDLGGGGENAPPLSKAQQDANRRAALSQFVVTAQTITGADGKPTHELSVQGMVGPFGGERVEAQGKIPYVGQMGAQPWLSGAWQAAGTVNCLDEKGKVVTGQLTLDGKTGEADLECGANSYKGSIMNRIPLKDGLNFTK